MKWPLRLFVLTGVACLLCFVVAGVALAHGPILSLVIVGFLAVITSAVTLLTIWSYWKPPSDRR